MPEKKKQHFVPRFYLKGFSVDPKRQLISLYVIRSDLHRSSVAIKDQAYEDYFYGKDNGVEEVLAKLEGSVSPIITRALTENALPDLGSSEHFTLLKFLLFQHSRTPSHADAINEHSEKLVNTLAAGIKDLKEKAGTLTVDDKTAPLMALAVAETLLPFATDLACKLIANITSRFFITSDHPSIFYNQFLETRKKGGGTTGVASKGLQIYLPIGPRHLIMLYDKNVYRVRPRNQLGAYIELRNEADIAGFNALQVANADEVIYFSADTDINTVHQAVLKGKPYALSSRAAVREVPALGPFGPMGSVIESSTVDLRLGFKPDLFAILPAAAGTPVNKWGVELRHPELVARYQEMTMPKRPYDARQVLQSFFNRS